MRAPRGADRRKWTATDALDRPRGGNGVRNHFIPPAGPARTLVWNCTGAVLTSSSDTNGTTTYGYTNPSDPFWRVTSIKDPTNAVTDITYTSNSVESVLNFASTSTVDILTTLDGLGRVSLTQRRQAQGSTTFDSVETTYDSLGRTYKVSPPYSAAEGGAYGGSTWNTTLYDALKRPTSVTDAGGGSVAFSYSANDMLRTVTPAPTGENPKKAQYQYDGLGRLKSVCEITGATGSGACTQNTAATGFFTSYTYDLLNNLKTVSQSGQGRTYYYDSLSRLTSEANPESGTTSYFYDTDSTCGTYDGDLVKRVDAVGNVICYAHDAVHRLSAVTYPSGQYSSVTPAKHFVYDSATVNGVAMTSAAGHLAEAYTCTGSCTSKLTDLGFSYSARGDVTGLLESTPSSGGYYSVGATYWPNGLLNVLSGTSMPTITYTPDGEGRVYTMTDNLGNTPVSNTSYNVFGLPTGLALGSGDSDAYVYDPNTGRMTKYQFNVNGQSMVGNITWNPNGTLEQLAITDPFNSSDQQTCKYVYDDLARAASINCTLNPSGTANWTQAFSFDAFGNIDKTGNNGGISFLPTYTSNPPTNRYASLPSGTPSYDANGNVLADGFHNYTWDADGNWATIDGAVIIYDALDRIVDEGPGLPYVYGPDGSKLGWYANQQALGNERAPMPGGGRAVYGSNPPLALQQYWHANWQGSTPLATGPNRTVYQDGAFAPYGEPFAGYPNGDFTGQVNDWDPDLYDFLYREYQLTQGRWVSPDPAGLAAANPADPQSWNRYAYVRNNPTSLIDPTGLGDCGGNTSFDCNNGGVPLPPPNRGGGGDGGGGGGVPGGTSCYVDNVEEPCSTTGIQLQAGAVSPCPNNVCSGFFTNKAGVTQYYQYWAFAGAAGVANGLYPGLTPLNPNALAENLSLSYEQFVSTHPGLEIGGYIYTDGRAGVGNSTVYNDPNDWGGVDPNPAFNLIPSYGDPVGFWHSQFGADFNDPQDRGTPAVPSYVGTPKGTVFMNTGPGTTCILTGPNPNSVLYSGCH